MPPRTSLLDEPEETLALREGDHQRVKDLFHHYQRSRDPHQRQQLAAHVFVALELYALVEETMFYPAGAQATAQQGDARDEDAQEELQRIRGLLAQLRACDPKDVGFDPRFQALMDGISHRTEEAEEQRRAVRAQMHDTSPALQQDTLGSS
jgi:hypothetical protein